MQGVQYVVHAAARIHVMQDRAADPRLEYHNSNVQGTLALAHQAAALEVRRFVSIISSIKANGETTAAGPFLAHDTPQPVDPCGVSKFEAENGLSLCESLQLDVSAARNALAWSPPVSLDEGLTRTAAGFLSETRL